MSSKFTEEAGQVLHQSKIEMLNLQQREIEPEHLLLALLKNVDSTAGQLLTSFAVDFEQMRNTLVEDLRPDAGDRNNQASDQNAEDAQAGKANDKDAPQEKTPISPRSIKAIQQSVKEQRRSRQELIGTEHLLLGILSEETTSTATQILGTYGINAESARTRLAELIAVNPEGFPEMQKARNRLIELDAEKQARVQKYLRTSRLINYAYMVIFLGLIAACYFYSASHADDVMTFVFTLFSSPLFSFEPVARWHPFQMLAVFAFLMIGLLVFFFPYSLLISFYLPRRYGIRKPTFWRWFNASYKQSFLTLIDLGIFLELFSLFLAVQPKTWWLWIAGCFVVYSLLRANLNPILWYPLFYKVSPIRDENVIAQLTALTKRANTQVRGFFQLEPRGKGASERVMFANAYLMGWGQTRRIVVTNSLLKFFTPLELESILAHELGHHIHHDLWRKLLVNALLTTVCLFLVHLITDSVTPRFFFEDSRGLLNSFYDYFSSFFVAIYLIYMGYILLTKAYSRRREFYADEYALRLTNNIVAFKNSEIHMANFNAIPARLSRWRELFSTHPSTEHRLQHAEQFEARQKASVSQQVSPR